MQRGSASKLGQVGYSRVGLWDDKCNPNGVLITISISITTTKLWESNYSDYQEYLFNRILEFKDKSVTPIGYRKISKILNEEGLKSSMDRPFTNVLIFGLYTKGKVRQERLDRKDIVEVSNPVVELIYLSY